MSKDEYLRPPGHEENFMSTMCFECPFCGQNIESQEGLDGECPTCGEKFSSEFDGDYGEDSVMIPIWERKQ